MTNSGPLPSPKLRVSPMNKNLLGRRVVDERRRTSLRSSMAVHSVPVSGWMSRDAVAFNSGEFALMLRWRCGAVRAGRRELGRTSVRVG